MEDCEAADAGVEHTDRTLRVHALMVVGAPSDGGTREYDRRVRLLCIHHEPSSDGGTLLAPARAGGWAIEHWHAHAGEPRPGLDGVDAVVAYGGTMNPDEDARLAWLGDVRATLAEAVERDAAVLGICLGAQLLGQALGAQAPRLAQPELGWLQVELTAAGAEDVLLAPLGPSCEVFQWHDYGCELPPGAVPLARSELAPQQAYRVGDAVWAVQFHIEVDADSVAHWTGLAPEIVRARGAEPAELVARARAYEPEYVAIARAFMSRFLTAARSRAGRRVA
jgi:GMP synthase (glutamine-hydrolysing)